MVGRGSDKLGGLYINIYIYLLHIFNNKKSHILPYLLPTLGDNYIGNIHIYWTMPVASERSLVTQILHSGYHIVYH